MKKNSPGFKKKSVTIERYFSKMGLGSRGETRAWILAGEVHLNGIICRDPETWVDLENDRIERFGNRVDAAEFRAIAFHKPRGLVTTRSDEQGRPTVFGALPAELGYLHAAGRLDQATSGILILTNSTTLSAFLTEPSNLVARVYLATVRGEWSDEKSARAQLGIIDAGELLRADACICRKRSGRESHIVLTLTEGKNREIRRLVAVLGNPITRLRRVEFGPFVLGNLAPGEYREISKAEVESAFPKLKLK